MSDAANLSEVEHIKVASNYLRGTIREGLADQITGALPADDTQLTKFHGIYQQDDRDLRKERQRSKLEPYYMFMVRVRVPGGRCTPEQYLAMDALSDSHANGTIKLTTRQAFQLHGIIKRNLKGTIAGINASLMDTIAACGDVNRNVMATVDPAHKNLDDVQELAKEISDLLTPQTSAYFELWLDGEKVTDSRDAEPDHEPVYGQTYLPRKFKIAIAIPPSNDVDVFANDLGLIAIEEKGKIVGYNVSIGGGMGTTYNMPETYPRLGSVIGFCTPEQAAAVSKEVVTVQRDYGDRTNRKHARLKYTIDDHGVDWFREQVEERLGWKLEPARSFTFTTNEDRFGWVKTGKKWHLTLFIEHGRIVDTEDYTMRTGLREMVKMHKGYLCLTGNQHLVFGDVTEAQKKKLIALMDEYGISERQNGSGLRQHSMACVGLNTCALAFSESERYLPDLVSAIEPVLEKHGLRDEPITIRMTGCPNGCGRPFLGEIAFTGKSMGRYNMYLGASFTGDRLNKPYKENLNEEQIVAELDPLLGRFAAEREEGEHFGDFLVRTGVVAEVVEGRHFWS